MTRLTRLTWKNFRSYGNYDTVYEFVPGVTAVRGRNGSGKTTLAAALYYVLYGKPLDGKVADLVNDRSGSNALVSLEFERGGKSYRIERGEAPKILRLFENGEERTLPSNLKDAQNEIFAAVGLDEEAFRKSVFLNSEIFASNFVTATPAQRRAIIDASLGLSLFDDLKKEALLYAKEISVERSGKSKEAEAIRKSLERENAESLKKRLSELAEERKRLEKETERSVRAEETRKKLDETKKLLAEKESLLSEMRRLAEKIYESDNDRPKTAKLLVSDLKRRLGLAEKFLAAAEDRKKKLAELRKRLIAAEKELSVVEAEIAKFRNFADETRSKLAVCSGCPKVGKLMKNFGVDSVGERLAGLSKRKKELSETVASVGKETELLERRVSGEGRVREKRAVAERLLEIAERFIEIGSKLPKNVSELVSAMEKEIADVVPKKEIERRLSDIAAETEKIEKRVPEIESERKRLGVLEKEIVLLERKESDARSISKKLSSVSLRAKILSSAIPFVNAKINGYLKLFGNDGFVVSLERDGTLVVRRGGREIDPHALSKGETLKITLSVTLGFSSLFERRRGKTNVLILDEVDGVLDEENFSRMLELLGKIDKSVTFITHRDIPGDFGGRIVAVEKKGVSRMEVLS